VAGLVLQDAPRPVRIATLKGQRNEPVLGTHLSPTQQSECTRCFQTASPSPNRRVVTHGKQRGVLASTKKIGHLLRKKKRLNESLQLKEKKIKVSRAGFT